MKTIWKYQIPGPHFSLQLPKGAKILAVQQQRNFPTMWALVDSEAEVEPRTFRTFGTGHEIDSELSLKYITTFQMFEGDLIWHLFEEQSCQSLVPTV